MNRICNRVLSMAILLTAPTAGYCDWYIGVAGHYGQLTADEFNVPSGGSYDGSLAASASAGYSGNDVIVDVSYLYFDEFSFDSPILTNSFFNLQGPHLSVGGQRPFGQHVLLEFRVGVFNWQAEATYEGTDIGEIDDGFTPTGMAQLRFPVTDNLHLYTEYTYIHDVLDSKINLLGGGIRFSF